MDGVPLQVLLHPAGDAPPPTQLRWVGEVQSRRPPRAHGHSGMEAVAVAVTPAAKRRHHRRSMAILGAGPGGVVGRGAPALPPAWFPRPCGRHSPSPRTVLTAQT